MTSWRSLVGQVTRFRRAIARVFARVVVRRRRGGEHVAFADEPASGPPAHWVERVRRGAPGLLEPSLRQRIEAARPPAAERVVLSPTELEPQRDSPGESERDDAPPEPPVGPRRPGSRVRASLLPKVLRRKRAPSAVPQAAVEASPAPTPDDTPRELHDARRRSRESADSPAVEPPDRRRAVGEVGRTPAHPSPSVAGRPERSSQSSEVAEFDAPTRRRTIPMERTAHPDGPVTAGARPPATEPPQADDRPVTAGVARPTAAEPPHPELVVDGVGAERVWEQAVAPPARRRESDAERVREPGVRRPSARLESTLEAGPPSRSGDEPLSWVDTHPWPELPSPLDQADFDVDAALRAWDRQQRLDREQTRL